MSGLQCNKNTRRFNEPSRGVKGWSKVPPFNKSWGLKKKKNLNKRRESSKLRKTHDRVGNRSGGEDKWNKTENSEASRFTPSVIKGDRKPLGGRKGLFLGDGKRTALWGVQDTKIHERPGRLGNISYKGDFKWQLTRGKRMLKRKGITMKKGLRGPTIFRKKRRKRGHSKAKGGGAAAMV